jgi:peptide chain release factor 3
MRYILNLIELSDYNQSFGSALNNFGVRELLDCFVEIAPSPRPKESETRIVDPKEEKMSGFVLKSMRIWIKTPRQVSIYKIVSGTFEGTSRTTTLRKKELKILQPQHFCRKKRNRHLTPVTLWAYDTGNFKIALTEGEL